MKKMCTRLYDKHGREIYPGDLLKVFHFIGKRRKKHYMYKYVICYKDDYLILSHLNIKNEKYSLLVDNSVLESYEIIQGYGCNNNDGFLGRKKNEQKDLH